MKVTKTVIVPKPCHEDWGKMSPEEKGRHCSVCSTLVVDFSSYTTPELIEYLLNAKGKICGRFHPEQLNRPLPIPVHNNSSFLQKALLGGALAASLSLTSGAQTVTGKVKISNTNVSSMAIHPIIYGTLVDAKTKKALKYLRVNVQGTSYGMETDSLGNFSFCVPDDLLDKAITFEVHEYPYAKNTTTVKAGKYPANLKIELKKTPESKRVYRTIGCPSF